MEWQITVTQSEAKELVNKVDKYQKQRRLRRAKPEEIVALILSSLGIRILK